MNKGRIELAIGPMFAGKTTWLINKLVEQSPENILTVYYFLDNRYENNFITTHDRKKLKAIAVKDEEDIVKALKETPKATVLGVDELQFFKPSIAQLFKTLKKEDMTILVAGLNVDHNNIIWEATKETQQVADKIHNFTATCSYCGKKNATITNRKGRRKERIIIGGSELYESLCEKDYLKAISR